MRLCLPDPQREVRAPRPCAGVRSMVTAERRVLTGKPIQPDRLGAGAAVPSSEGPGNTAQRPNGESWAGARMGAAEEDGKVTKGRASPLLCHHLALSLPVCAAR